MTLSIIITIIAWITWWWLIQQSLQFYHLRTSTILVLLWVSIMGVLSIISFPHIYSQIYQQSRTKPLTILSVSQYIWYIILIWYLINMVLFYRSWKDSNHSQLIFITIITIINIVLPIRWIYPTYYYLIAASIEEYIKYYLWYWSFKLYGISSSDIILFGMLSWLWFACIENIVYLYSAHYWTPEVIHTTARWIIWPIVHMIYSWGLAYWYRYWYRKWWGIRWLCMGIIWAVSIHTIYNAYLINQWRWIIATIVVFWYIMISWLIYQCDRLYFEAKNNLKTTS